MGQLEIAGMVSDTPSVRAITDTDVRRGLERRYADGWAVLHEVSNHLGWMPSEKQVLEQIGGSPIVSKRYLDTVAIGMYRSTDYEIIGHEIKVSRADWLAELRQPHKAAAFGPLLSRFYLVAPRGVVKPGELPGGWGLLLYYPSCIRVGRRADLHQPSVPLSWVASLVARALNLKRLEGA